MMTAWLPERYRAVVFGTLSFVFLAVIWEAAVRLGWMNPFFSSQPSAIAVTLVKQVETGELWDNLSISLLEFVIGFSMAVVVGIFLGVLAGWYRKVEYAIDPYIWFLYSAPLIAFYPLFVVWLGLGMGTVIAITFLLAVTPIVVNTLTGIRNVSPELVRAAVSFGAKKHDIFIKVALPASVPMVMAGLRLGIGRALTGVIIAELFGATAGLGFSISYYGANLQTDDMMGSLIMIVLLGVIFTQGLRFIESRFDSWRTGPGT